MVHTTFGYQFRLGCKFASKCGLYHLCPLFNLSLYFFAPFALHRFDVNQIFHAVFSVITHSSTLVTMPFKARKEAQCAKKVVSNSSGLVDFATGLANFVLNLPDRQVEFFGEFTVINPAHQKKFGGLYKMTLGLADSSYSLPKWQAVKLTFFAP